MHVRVCTCVECVYASVCKRVFVDVYECNRCNCTYRRTIYTMSIRVMCTVYSVQCPVSQVCCVCLCVYMCVYVHVHVRVCMCVFAFLLLK